MFCFCFFCFWFVCVCVVVVDNILCISKGGYGEDLQQLPSSRDFFIGLENLHHLTMQAEYTLHVSFYGGVIPYGHLYDNFTIGPESTSYELTFSSYVHLPHDDASCLPICVSAFSFLIFCFPNLSAHLSPYLSVSLPVSLFVSPVQFPYLSAWLSPSVSTSA